MKKAYLVFSMLVLPILIMLSCSKNGGDNENFDCTGVTASYSTNAGPLFQTYCNQPACHDAASTNDPGPLTNYSQIYTVRLRIREQVKQGLMPQNTTLTAEQKKIIICWIDSGASY
ncbi:MAG TPA: hypothetical protein VF476_11575 [Chitinophagaceae bacterium]